MKNVLSVCKFLYFNMKKPQVISQNVWKRKKEIGEKRKTIQNIW